MDNNNEMNLETNQLNLIEKILARVGHLLDIESSHQETIEHIIHDDYVLSNSIETFAIFHIVSPNRQERRMVQSTHVVKIAMKSMSLSRYYRQNCKNSRLFSRNPTFAEKPLGYHQKHTYYEIDYQMVFYYQYLSLLPSQGKTLKIWKYRHLV